MKRNKHLDIAKGIGMILVILGHNGTILTDYIYSFHMPLFFIISGVFHNQNLKIMDYLKKKIKNILIPYFLISGILFLFWLFIGRKIGESSLKKTPITQAVLGIFTGVNLKEISSIEWGIPMWFLPCLFITSILYYILKKYSSKYTLMISLFFSILIVKFGLESIILPYSFLTAVIAVFFYGIGARYKEYFISDEKKYGKYIIFIFLISVVLFKLNGRVDMFGNHYNNILIFYIDGILGSLTVLIISKYIKSELLGYIGSNSLFFLAFHGRAMTVIKFFLKYVFHIKYTNNLLPNLIYTAVQVFLCLVLTKIIKYILAKK